MRLIEIIAELRASKRLTADDWALITEMQALLLSGGNRSQTPRSAEAERARRYRERKRDESVTNVTTSITQFPPKEKNQTPLPPETLRVSTPKATRGTRLPADWNPSECLWSWGKTKLSLSDEVLRFETGAFRDHFWAAAGQRGVKLDWDATWKNWMREAKRRQKKLKPNVVEFVSSGPKRSWAEIKAEREKAGSQ